MNVYSHRIALPVLLIIAFVLLLPACSPATGPLLNTPTVEGTVPPDATAVASPLPDTATPDLPQTGQAPEPVLSAQQALAGQLGVQQEGVEIQDFEETEFPNACLGLPQENELCAEVLTSGYQGTFVVEDVRYQFRVSQTGDNARFVPLAAAEARQVLSEQLEVPVEQIQVVSYEQVEFPDACLGVEQEGMACAEVITPGFVVTLQANGERYEFHTDLPGDNIIQAQNGDEGASAAVIQLQREGGLAGFCDDLRIQPTGEVEIRNCPGAQPGEPVTGELSEDQMQQLEEFVSTFQSFEFEMTDPAEADALTQRLVFRGVGQQLPDNEQQQEILNFAQEVLAQLSGSDSVEAGEIQAARMALENYFAALREGDYESAVELYGGSYEVLTGYNPTVPVQAQEELLEAACALNGFRCDLSILEIVSAERIDSDQYRFTVRFSTADNEPFELGPCCGADPTAEPPVDEFQFTVSADENGQYRVQDLPVYVP